ncbi:MAG: hypothetical protein ACRDYD_07770, partial [Acidimicrobiales bacterium]
SGAVGKVAGAGGPATAVRPRSASALLGRAPSGLPPALGHTPAAGGGRRVTALVVAFCLLVIAVLGGAVGAVYWYSRSSYFVTLRTGRVVVEQGRPGGVLWIRPTVIERTSLLATHVLASRLPALLQGTEEPSLAAARRYVANLRAEYAAMSLPPGGTGSSATVPAGTSQGAGTG